MVISLPLFIPSFLSYFITFFISCSFLPFYLPFLLFCFPSCLLTSLFFLPSFLLLSFFFLSSCFFCLLSFFLPSLLSCFLLYLFASFLSFLLASLFPCLLPSFLAGLLHFKTYLCKQLPLRLLIYLCTFYLPHFAFSVASYDSVLFFNLIHTSIFCFYVSFLSILGYPSIRHVWNPGCKDPGYVWSLRYTLQLE